MQLLKKIINIKTAADLILFIIITGFKLTPLIYIFACQNPIYQFVMFDIHGQALKRIVEEELQAGIFNVKFNAESLAPGTYFYRLTGSGVNLTRKLMLMK